MIAPTQRELTNVDVPLSNGDRLTAEEFCRRWDLTPNLKHAELLGGQVFMNPPISSGSHGVPQIDISSWLWFYAAGTPGTQAIGESSVRFGPTDLPQPDALLRIREESGGTSHFKDQELYGSPELIVEVAASNAAYDLFDKKQTYLLNSIQEYLVWIVYEQKFVWFELQNSQYAERPVARTGILKSAVFPGLWLDTRAILGQNQTRLIATLQQGLDSAEHAEFVTRLKSQTRKKKKRNT